MNIKTGIKIIALLLIGAVVGSITTLLYLQFRGADIEIIAIKDAVLLVIGALVGLVSTYWFFYSQFSKGNGGRRMRTIIDASTAWSK